MRITLTMIGMGWLAITYGQAPAEAQKLYDQGNYVAALQALDNDLGSVEASGEVLRLRGDCYQKDERFEEALSMYERAQKIDSESAILNANHASAYINLKLYREAEKKLKKALKLDPSLPEGHYFLGNVKYFSFEMASAVKCYDEALRLQPNYRDALYMRAATYAEMENFKKAVRDYETALEIDPNLHVARYNIAVIQLRNDNFEKAADMLQSIDPATLPSSADYYFSLGEALYFDNKREEACEYYEMAMDMGDEESEKIFMKYCIDKETRDAKLRTRTIRMAF